MYSLGQYLKWSDVSALNMVKIVSKFLTVLCVCFTEVHCTYGTVNVKSNALLYSVDPWWDPRVWPDTFADDGKPFVELTCGAYLKSYERLSWHKYGDTQTFSITKSLNEGYRTLKLLWPLASLKNKKVYCLKSNGTQKTLSKPIPITFKKNKYPEITDAGWGPWVIPAEFVDDGERVEFTSYAYLMQWQMLSCYQIKDRSESQLGMIQQENEYSYVKITLQKTLEPSDNGSNIYCYTVNKHGKTIKSNYITIKLEGKMEAVEPYVSVEPGTDMVFFDEGDALEVACGGSRSDDGRSLAWYLQIPGLSKVIPPYQYFYKYTNQNRLTLRMDVFDHGKLLYCAQELPSGTVTKNGEPLVRSRTITLLHRAKCDTRDQPRVIPSTFVDEHKPWVQFSCYAFLKSGQLLSWYQSTGLNESAGSLLRMIQHQDPKTKEGEWKVLILNKTLEPSDNGSNIYCAQQSVRPDGSFSGVLKQSQRIALNVQRYIQPLEPFIHVEPNNASVSFDVNSTLRFTCGGSKPVDGRTYTWFSKGSESSLIVPKNQEYDASTNLNVLDLSSNEAHHLNNLFCAQGFLSYIRDTDGSLHVKSYGDLVISNITTLIQQEKDEEKQELLEASPTCPGNTHLLLTVATPLALLALVAAVTACWALRRRRTRAARPAPARPAPPAAVKPAVAKPALAPRPNTDDIYVNLSRMASPEVTYAVLDLPRSAGAARAPPAPDQTLYAEIARASPQVTYATLELPDAAPAPPAPPASEASLYAEIARGHKRKQ